MDDYVTFEGQIIPLEWGKSAYTVLPVPDDVIEALGKTRRVAGKIADHPVSLALTKASVIGQVLLYTGKTLLKQIGIAPGDVVEVRLRPDTDDTVEVPDDVLATLPSVGAIDNWTALTPGKQRGLLHPVTTAKRPETRAKRIANLLKGLPR